MIAKLTRKRYGPIGVDLGSRSIKLIQFSADHTRMVDSVRWELPVVDRAASDDTASRWDAFAAALWGAREGRNFRGRDAVVCMGAPELFAQNVRVAKVTGTEMGRLVQQEAAGRLPFPPPRRKSDFSKQLTSDKAKPHGAK